MVSYCKQIEQILLSFLPFTGINFNTDAQKQVTNIAIDGDKMVLTLTEDDYAIIAEKLSDNRMLTVNGLYIKNEITSFVYNPQRSSFKVIFKKELPGYLLTKDSLITLEGFTITSYNTRYKITRIDNNKRELEIANISVPLNTITQDLGYTAIQYAGGFNGLQMFTDESSTLYQVSFTIPNNALTTQDINEICIDRLPRIIDYSYYIKAVGLSEWFKRDTREEKSEFLIIDTKSLTASGYKSKGNSTDSLDNTSGLNGQFWQNYSLSVYYVIERNSDDDNNETDTNGDFETKQIEMARALYGLLRRSLDDDRAKYGTTGTLYLYQHGLSPETIKGGMIAIRYDFSFSVEYNENAYILDINSSKYKINEVVINDKNIMFD